MRSTIPVLRLFIVLIFTMSFTSIAQAGHLFTQASANTPINLSSGKGIQITQLTYETFGGTNGNVTIDFNDEMITGDATKDWSAGDAIQVTIGSWANTYTFDTLLTDGDLSGVSQDGGNINIGVDATLLAANITPEAGDKFIVIAKSGQFTFSGYRIYVNGKTFNGTGADTITQSQVVDASDLGDNSFEAKADSNQKGLGQHLDKLSSTATGELATVITVLSAMTDESKELAIKLISPEQSQILGASATKSVSTGFDTVQVRLDTIRNGTDANAQMHHDSGEGMSSGDAGILERNAWVKALGGKAEQDASDGFAGSDSDFYGVMGGLDYTFENQLTLGAAFAYGRTDVSMTDYRNGDGADIDTYQVTAYFNKSLERIYVEGMLSYAYQNYETKRNTHLTGVAQGDFNGDMVSARLISGLPLAMNDKFTITPFIGAEAYHLRQRGYTEKGAGVLSLDVSSNEANRFRSIVGTKFGYHTELADGSILSPIVQLTWKHEFKDDGIKTTSSFLGGGGQFQSVGQDVDRDIYGVSGRLDWAKTDQLSLGIELGAEAASNYLGYNGQLYGKWRF